MASNDMNSWDDNPDEQLRQRWQQTFTHFKVDATSSLRDRILNAQPTQRRRRRAYQIVGLLLVISAGLLYPLRLGEHPYSGWHGIIARPTTPASPPLTRRIGWSGTVSGGLRSTGPVRDPLPGEFSTRWQPLAKQPAGTGMRTSRVDISSKPYILPQPSFTDQARLSFQTNLRLRATAVSVDQAQVMSVPVVGIPLRVQRADSSATGRSEFVVPPIERSVRAHTDSSSSPLLSQPPAIQLLANQMPMVGLLKPVATLSLPSRWITLPQQLPLMDVALSQSAEDVAVRRHLHWFAEVVPLNSFQKMRAQPSATTYLSGVKAPAAFSPATLGYQVNGGIRWQHWQAQLSVGQFRRWAYYTVNENRYRVEPLPDNPNQLVRETYAVAENVSVPMMGVGLSQTRSLDRGRYRVDLGGQLWYLPTGQQAMISLQGGAGCRLVLGRAIELQVGLRAEYSLNQFLSDQQQLTIQPVLIGLGFRLQPRSFH